MTLFEAGVLLVAWQGIVSLWAGWKHLKYVRTWQKTASPRITPPAAVILPCRGPDDGFRDNLRALVEQDYPNFQLICVVDSLADPAYGEIRRVVGETGASHVHVVEAGGATGRGQKVHNLLAGLDYVERHLVSTYAVEVYVFADSDGQVNADWLRNLIGALDEGGVGATTGFRWYRVGESFWSLLRSLWNASIVTAFGPHRRNFAWGGSTAIRRTTAEAIRLRDAWQGAVSDDYALTEALRASGYWIKFVPSCLVVSSGGCSFRELIEFTNRQITITKVYAPKLWRMVCLTNLLFTVVFLSAIGLLLDRVARGGNLTWPMLALALIYLPGVAKGIVRVWAVGLMRPELADELQRFRWAYWLFHPLVSLLYVVNGFASAISREITWRGIRYRLVSPMVTEVIGPSEDVVAWSGQDADARSTATGNG